MVSVAANDRRFRQPPFRQQRHSRVPLQRCGKENAKAAYVGSVPETACSSCKTHDRCLVNCSRRICSILWMALQFLWDSSQQATNPVGVLFGLHRFLGCAALRRPQAMMCNPCRVESRRNKWSRPADGELQDFGAKIHVTSETRGAIQMLLTETVRMRHCVLCCE